MSHLWDNASTICVAVFFFLVSFHQFTTVTRLAGQFLSAASAACSQSAPSSWMTASVRERQMEAQIICSFRAEIVFIDTDGHRSASMSSQCDCARKGTKMRGEKNREANLGEPRCASGTRCYSLGSRSRSRDTSQPSSPSLRCPAGGVFLPSTAMQTHAQSASQTYGRLHTAKFWYADRG